MDTKQNMMNIESALKDMVKYQLEMHLCANLKKLEDKCYDRIMTLFSSDIDEFISGSFSSELEFRKEFYETFDFVVKAVCSLEAQKRKEINILDEIQ